jgi:hypothetical protein
MIRKWMSGWTGRGVKGAGDWGQQPPARHHIHRWKGKETPVYRATEWTDSGDEFRYLPGDLDASEAAAMFDSYANGTVAQDEFDEWLSDLPDVDFVDITRASDTIRRRGGVHPAVAHRGVDRRARGPRRRQPRGARAG